MSDFVKGLLFGSVGIIFIFHYLSKILLWMSATSAKQGNETRDQFINSRITSYRKKLERILPYWEEV
jgi:hypothetical protein